MACDVAIKNGVIDEVAPPKSLRGIDCSGLSGSSMLRRFSHPFGKDARPSARAQRDGLDQRRFSAGGRGPAALGGLCMLPALRFNWWFRERGRSPRTKCVSEGRRREAAHGIGALQTAYVHGSKAIRTHLDGTAADDQKLVDTVYSAFRELRDEYATKGLVVQGVANLYLPLWSDPNIAKLAADRAFKEGAILGAYCGNVAETTPEETLKHCAALFTHAIRLKLPVDCHVDETNDARCRGLSALAHALLDARAVGYDQPVVFGHCTALALQSPKILNSICQALAQCKPCLYCSEPLHQFRIAR